jgi:Uma2 family endonuclease
MSSIKTVPEVEYPESDGLPMGETDLHRSWMVRIHDILSRRYRGQRVYVGCNLIVYFAEGRPYLNVVPDNFVVLCCDPAPRRVYKVWEETGPPQVVFEVTSRGTRREDQVHKPKTYGQIGVEELFLYDPTAEYLKPSLQGFRFLDGEPESIGAESGAFVSRVLGLTLQLEHGQLTMIDSATGELQLTEAEWEHSARLAAEAEVRRLQSELDRFRRGQE